MKRRRTRRRDPVTPLVYSTVRQRDNYGCVGRLLASTAKVGDREVPIFPGPCEGPIELDHIMNGGLSLRGPSTVDNLVSLCRWHHRWKTENATLGRAVLAVYIETKNRHRGRRAESGDEE